MRCDGNREERVRFYYIDDFITVCAPGSAECATNMEKISQACQETGVPIGPATRLQFLGLGIGNRGDGNLLAKKPC